MPKKGNGYSIINKNLNLHGSKITKISHFLCGLSELFFTAPKEGKGIMEILYRIYRRRLTVLFEVVTMRKKARYRACSLRSAYQC